MRRRTSSSVASPRRAHRHARGRAEQEEVEAEPRASRVVGRRAPIQRTPSRRARSAAARRRSARSRAAAPGAPRPGGRGAAAGPSAARGPSTRAPRRGSRPRRRREVEQPPAERGEAAPPRAASRARAPAAPASRCSRASRRSRESASVNRISASESVATIVQRRRVEPDLEHREPGGAEHRAQREEDRHLRHAAALDHAREQRSDHDHRADQGERTGELRGGQAGHGAFESTGSRGSGLQRIDLDPRPWPLDARESREREVERVERLHDRVGTRRERIEDDERCAERSAGRNLLGAHAIGERYRTAKSAASAPAGRIDAAHPVCGPRRRAAPRKRRPAPEPDDHATRRERLPRSSSRRVRACPFRASHGPCAVRRRRGWRRATRPRSKREPPIGQSDAMGESGHQRADQHRDPGQDRSQVARPHGGFTPSTASWPRTAIATARVAAARSSAATSAGPVRTATSHPHPYRSDTIV